MSKKVITGFKNTNADDICPCCKERCNIPLYSVRGIFKLRKIYSYTCSYCGCQWEVEK